MEFQLKALSPSLCVWYEMKSTNFYDFWYLCQVLLLAVQPLGRNKYYTLDVMLYGISIKPPQYGMEHIKPKKKERTDERKLLYLLFPCININTHIKNEIIFICETATNCIESFTMRHNILRNVVISILVP